MQRIFETMFIHKFSHATMPIFNLFKNCSYYWAFAAFVSYFINHPLYTPPPISITVACLVTAYFCQVISCLLSLACFEGNAHQSDLAGQVLRHAESKTAAAFMQHVSSVVSAASGCDMALPASIDGMQPLANTARQRCR